MTAAVLVEDVNAGIGGANVVTNEGTTKSGLPWTVELATAEETDENPTPEAWASSWPEDEPGTPPKRGRYRHARG